MLRFLLSILVVFCLVAPAEAGRAGAQFTVGIRVLPKGKKPRGEHITQSQYTFNAAHVTLIRARYHSIRKISAGRTLYWFKANRRGASYRVAVSRSRGKIVKIAQR